VSCSPVFLVNSKKLSSEVSVDSDSELPQVACNDDPAEKSIDPKGYFLIENEKQTVNCTTTL